MKPIDNTTCIRANEFNIFYKKYYSSFCSFANRFVNDTVMAEDIVGDVAIKVWEKKGGLRNPNALRSYFYTSIRNTCLTHITDKKKNHVKAAQYKVTMDTYQPSFFENVVRTETFNQLEAAIKTLPGQCKKVFIKHYFEEKSFSEIASEMNLSISTVKNQRLRGIKLLRNKLAPVTTIAFMLLYLYL